MRFEQGGAEEDVIEVEVVVVARDRWGRLRARNR